MSAKYEERIAALLRKAEDPAATPAEAEAYTAKAEALMIKWGISEAVARSRAGQDVARETIVERRYLLTGTYHRGFYEIGSAVAGAMRLRVLVSKSQYRTILYVIGHESDVDRFEVLYDSLRLQVVTAMNAWTRDEKATGRWDAFTHHEKFKARRQFLMSFGWTVARRLRALTRDEVATYAGKAEIALRDRSAEVDDWVKDQHPRLRASRGSLDHSWYGDDAGREAGKRARIGGDALPGGRRGIR